MRKIGLLKVVLVIILSVLLIANLTSVVFAADDFSSTNASEWENAGVPETGSSTDNTGTTGTENSGTTTGTENSGTGTTGTGTTGTENSGTGTDSTSLSTGSATTTLNSNEDEEENKSEVNSLAYTGIEDNKVLPVVIIIGAIVAGYSLKKVREYNNI